MSLTKLHEKVFVNSGAGDDLINQPAITILQNQVEALKDATEQEAMFDSIKPYLLDMFYPVGAHYIQMDSNEPENILGGTWQLDSTWNNTALIVDGTAGTDLAPTLPKPTVTLGTISAAVEEADEHTHTFTGTEVTTGDESATHTHARGNWEIEGTVWFCHSTNSKDSMIIQNSSGAFYNVGNTTTNTQRVYDIEAPYTRTATGSAVGFQASKSWAGKTAAESAKHKHSCTAGGTNSEVAAHKHKVTAAGTLTCDSDSTYSDGGIVRPDSITVKVWKRIA